MGRPSAEGGSEEYCNMDDSQPVPSACTKCDTDSSTVCCEPKGCKSQGCPADYFVKHGSCPPSTCEVPTPRPTMHPTPKAVCPHTGSDETLIDPCVCHWTEVERCGPGCTYDQPRWQTCYPGQYCNDW